MTANTLATLPAGTKTAAFVTSSKIGPYFTANNREIRRCETLQKEPWRAASEPVYCDCEIGVQEYA